MVVWLRMEVKMSRSSRSCGVAQRTPLVATMGRRSFEARLRREHVAGFLLALVMALEFDIKIVAAVDGDEAVEMLGCGGFALVGESGGERAFFAAGEADEAFGEFFEIFESGGAFSLGGFAHFEARDELAEVLIAGLGFASRTMRGGSSGNWLGR